MSETKKIEKLTPEQEARLPEKRDEWIKIGLSTEPANKVLAEEGADKAYRVAGLEPPTLKVWFDSPQGALEYILENTKDKKKAKEQIYNCIYGQHEAGWLSFYDTMGDVLGLECVKKLEGLMQVARNAGWWWPFDDRVLLTDRPKRVALDAEGRLHHESLKAIEYRDGWGEYVWHGVRVPEFVIEHPETITVKHIEDEQNAEVRRVMVTRYGEDRYITDSGAKLVHKDTMGELYQKDLPGDEALTMVKVLNSTPEPDGSIKVYFLRVDPRCRVLLPNNQFGPEQELTATNAIASTFGMTGAEYVLEVET